MDGEFAKVPVANGKDFRNEKPCNTRHSPDETGTREYFDSYSMRSVKNTAEDSFDPASVGRLSTFWGNEITKETGNFHE